MGSAGNYRFFIIALIIWGSFAGACSFKSANQRQLVYSSSGSQQVRIRLPGGKGEENFKTNLNGATEQFFTYQDGAVIYIARSIPWPTMNAARVEKMESQRNGHTASFTGVDDTGLHWKEVHIEGFKIGYAKVLPSRLEAFDRAILSIRIK